jgi:hypothetical protein
MVISKGFTVVQYFPQRAGGAIMWVDDARYGLAKW